MTSESNRKPLTSGPKRKHWAAAAATILLFSAVIVFAVYEATKNTVTFTANGETQEFRTHAKTVGDFLTEQNVEVAEDDDLQPANDQKIDGDLAVEWDQAEQYAIMVDGEPATAWTTSSTVKDILEKADITVSEHDNVTPALDDTASPETPITIEKAYKVTLTDGLDKKEVWTTSTTVADFLKDNGVTLNELDRVKQKLDETVTPKSNIQVIRVEKVTDVVEDATNYAVVTQKDSSLLKGKEQIVQKGKSGLVKKTYEVIKENGMEVDRKLTSEKVVKEATNQVVAVGTKTVVASVSRGSSPAAAEAPSGGKEFYVSATAYTANCAGCSGITATGINLKANPHLKVIAVDPSVIPLGSKVWVEGYGYAVAGDTGGAIKGLKIDLFMASQSSAVSFGRQQVKVKVLN